MNRLILALALAPALLSTAALAQDIPEDIAKQLWCGTALSLAFAEPPPDLSDEEKAEVKMYQDGAVALLEIASQAHLDAGMTQEQLDQHKVELAAEVLPIISGEVEGGYTFEECVALIPPPADGQPAT